ncbi:unnamed protein product [Amaranthus hypochondriacus]
MSKTHLLSTSMLLFFTVFIQTCFPIWVSFVHSFSEKEILLRIKQQWGNQPAMKTWNSTTEPCHWPGIKCADGLSVTEISLDGQNIHGKIPPSICDLKNLTVLNLGDNFIEGNFPTFLYNCTKLQRLNLSNNLFVGRLPNDINNLTSKLQHLILYANNFTGNIPTSLSQLSALLTLHLAGNFFTGTIPSQLANLVSMEYLNLGMNDLVGEIPSGLFMLKNLTILYFYENNLSGGIPTSIKALNLVEIDLSKNNLTGTIPEEFGNLSKLEAMHLFQNQFHGTLPPSTGRLPSLASLMLSNNFFSGPLPPEMGLHSKLERFWVSTNAFTGQLPEHLCSGGKLAGVRAFNNYLNGTIPGSLGNCSTLSTIKLSNNRLFGVLPPELGFHPNLLDLSVSQNKLSGVVPESLANISTLEYLFLDQNKFSGEVPSRLFMAPSIIYLVLNDNNFTGSLPSKLSENMAFLELSNNIFSGIIPSSVSQWRNLRTLRASNNNFCGNIPVELTALSSLTTLALDGNQLSGKLPVSIISWKSLIFLNLARNKLSGQLPEALGFLPNLYELDLSHNNLSGEIPTKLAQLTKGPRQFVLNLSSNCLTGEIPHALDNEEFQNSFFDNANLCTHNHISNLPQCSASRRKYIILILLPGAAIFMIFLYFTFFKVHIGKKEQHNSSEQQDWKLKPFHKVEFTEKMIVSGLDDNNKIGFGGSGKVYRVVMNDSGGKVAVKKIWNGRKLEGALKKQFSTEIEILGTIRHANIVKLLCYVSSAQDKLLVYEYVENQSLDKWLHRKMEGNESSSIHSETSMNSHAPFILDWATRLKIAVGAAKGLCYLHYDCSPSIVHRDVKSSNILLDSEFNAKIADFGLATVSIKNGEPQIASGIKGSFGYIAPEYWRTKKLNVRIDVYSFGVVLLEMVTGKEPCKGNDHLNLADWSWQWYCEELPIVDALDEAIKEPSIMEQMVNVFKLGLMCTSKNPVSRPNMKQVLQVLTMNSHHENNSHPQTMNDE